MNPFQREHQITIPSSEPVRSKGAEMIDATKRRRSFQGRSFSKQTFYNCLILGLYDVESHRDLDHDAVEEKGLLAVLIDRGANELARLIASADAPHKPRGVRASIGEMDDDNDAIDEREAPEPPQPIRRKPPGLVVPRDWLAARNASGGGRAQKEAESADRRPIP